MSEEFDAYHKWLAIPPSEQPPHHYRLLGLPLFEADQEVIASAAVQRMNWVRKFQKGSHAQLANKLTLEIKEAWKTIINVETKRKYDGRLQEELDFPRSGQASPELPLMMGPDPSAALDELGAEQNIDRDFPPLPPAAVSPPELPPGYPRTVETAKSEFAKRADVRSVKKKRRKDSTPVLFAKIIGGGLLGLVLGYGILCLCGRDFEFFTASNSNSPHPKTAPAQPEVEKPAPRIASDSSKTNPTVVGPPSSAIPHPRPDAEEPAASIEQPAVGLSPVPDAAEQARVFDEIAKRPNYQIYLLAATGRAGKLQLAKKMLTDANLGNLRIAYRFVFLKSAMEYAAQAGDYDTAVQAVNALCRAFVVDGLELKATALCMAVSEAKDSQLQKSIDDLLCESIAATRYELARQLAVAGATLADRHGPDDEQRNAAAGLSVTKVEYLAAAESLAKLAERPQDEEEISSLGSFLCLAIGNWELGLPLLVHYPDIPLQKLAALEKQPPQGAAAQLSLADQWWDAAKTAPAAAAARMRLRAVHWYSEASQNLTGVDRVKAEYRSEIGGGGESSDWPKVANLSAIDLENEANKCGSARDALRLYYVYLVDDKVAETEKAVAVKRVPYWEDAAGKDLVHAGQNWISRDEARKKRADIKDLLEEGTVALLRKNSSLAMQALAKASRLDPVGVEPDALLGLVAAVREHDFPKAQRHFAECARREPGNAAILNDLALAEALQNEHKSALRHFKDAITANSSPEVCKGNIERLLDHASRGAIAISAADAKAYQDLLSMPAPGGTPNIRSGWVYLLPLQDDGDAPAGESPLFARISQLNLTAAVGSNWVADNFCIACRGTARQACPNPSCHNGTITKTVSVPVAPNAFGGATMGTRKVHEVCATCRGEGRVPCKVCGGKGTE